MAARYDAQVDDPMQFMGFIGGDDLQHGFAEHGWLTEDWGRLVVERGSQPIGGVSWHAERYGGNAASKALNIGILLDAAHRGHGYGTVAQRLLADYLFSTYAVHRLEAGTDVDNLAEQRSLEKAGFTREGVLRGAQWRAGGYRDLVLYSRLRGE